MATRPSTASRAIVHFQHGPLSSTFSHCIRLIHVAEAARVRPAGSTIGSIVAEWSFKMQIEAPRKRAAVDLSKGELD